MLGLERGGADIEVPEDEASPVFQEVGAAFRMLARPLQFGAFEVSELTRPRERGGAWSQDRVGVHGLDRRGCVGWVGDHGAASLGFSPPWPSFLRRTCWSTT